MKAEADIQITLQLRPYEVGQLLAQLSTIRDQAQDALDLDPSQEDLAMTKNELQFELRVRRQIEKQVGAPWPRNSKKSCRVTTATS